jgi:hypothetical protein
MDRREPLVTLGARKESGIEQGHALHPDNDAARVGGGATCLDERLHGVCRRVWITTMKARDREERRNDAERGNDKLSVRALHYLSRLPLVDHCPREAETLNVLPIGDEVRECGNREKGTLARKMFRHEGERRSDPRLRALIGAALI